LLLHKMVKLDVSVLRYMSKEEFRVLQAVELGMKNHEFVSTRLIDRLAKLKRGGAYKFLNMLHRNKLVVHESKHYDGYRLTYPGYDFLALHAFVCRQTVLGVGNQIGVGKESDIFVVQGPDEQRMALKLHRLGRVSFRSIKRNRDYLLHRKSASWLYLSRLAAMKEYAFMKVLHDNRFPVPKPIDVCRHAVVMELVDGYPLSHVRELGHPEKVYDTLMHLLVRMAKYGLIHCDFNEFNLIINDNEEITMIDFPQMVSTSHPNAAMYFDRDVQCIVTYFSRVYNFVSEAGYPTFAQVTKHKYNLDAEVHASGYSKEHQKEFEALQKMQDSADNEDDSKEEEEESEEDSEEEGSEEEEESEGAETSGEETPDFELQEKGKELQQEQEESDETEDIEENSDEENNQLSDIPESSQPCPDVGYDSEVIKKKVKSSMEKRNKRRQGRGGKTRNTYKNKARQKGNKTRMRNLY